MGKVILYIAQSVDGYIARKAGDISWLQPYENQAEDYGYNEFYKDVGTLIMGSTTYEQVLTFGDWPHGDRRTYVITTRELPKVPNADIEFYSGDLAQLVKRIKAANDEDIWLVGGAKLVSSFMNEGLVDELMLFVVPILLKDGIRLFDNLSDEMTLRFLNSVSYSSGITQLHYAVTVNRR